MGLFGLFGSKSNVKSLPKFFKTLDEDIVQIFPTLPEPKRLELACVAGLLGKMIVIDGSVDERERQTMVESLVTWMKLSTRQSKLITSIAIDKMKLLNKTDSTEFAEPLVESVTHMRRFELMMALFGIAAADENVDAQEIAELRKINKALGLETKDFQAAEATVKEFVKEQV